MERLHLVDSLVLLTDSGAGGADLTSWTLEFDVCAFAGATLTFTPAITELPVLGHARGNIRGAVAGTAGVSRVTNALPAFAASVSWQEIPKLRSFVGWDSDVGTSASLTSTEHVVGAVTVEVVALAELAAVAFCGILPLFALAGAADAVSVVAADVGTVVFSAVCVQVLCVHVILAALTHAPDTTHVTPEREKTRLTI